MAGTLVPPWYEEHPPSVNDTNIASMFWGFTLGVGLWSGVKGYRQTAASWRRIRRVNAYIWLVWAEWLASMVIGIISWCYLTGRIDTSFEYFFLLLVLWSIQVQCLMQVIINRIAILMPIQSQATKIKWGVFVVILAINVSVFCIWIPARLQISTTYVHVNEIWDRIEKGIFLLVDVGLNLTFIYLVKSRLISSGLTKYTRLFRFNLVMIAVSMSLDIILIGLMSLPNTLMLVMRPRTLVAAADLLSYAQFHPLAYLLKLHIEMGMADLIAKVVRESHSMNAHPESRRDSNEITPSTSATPDQKKSLSNGSRSRRFSVPYPGAQFALTSSKGSSTRNDPDEAGLELGPPSEQAPAPGPASQPDLQPEASATAAPVLKRPRLLDRHVSAPYGLGPLRTDRRSSSSQPDSAGTMVDQDPAWYV
ncbi:hypothetical protein CSOJ01_09485 [Colletotrichum sojae]|uniref:Integral membrane protein n=1 Tax=Colletotrichum sojae TaxID=2175907 RepID=A0A8H6MRF5_9PEZI|nr:hypothetical protein CSOJ01_09485 [Colletotrichum sojae]